MILLLLRRFWPHIAVALAVICGLWYVHHHGYKAGQEERAAHYQPILAEVDTLRIAAETRNAALVHANKAISATQELTRAQSETALQTRADHFERLYRNSLRALTARHGCPKPAAAAPAAEPESPAGIAACTGGNAAFARGIVERCVRDAQRLGEVQNWYEQQRKLLNP